MTVLQGSGAPPQLMSGELGSLQATDEEGTCYCGRSIPCGEMRDRYTYFRWVDGVPGEEGNGVDTAKSEETESGGRK